MGEIKTITKKELREKYNVSYFTLKKWLIKVIPDYREKRIFTVKEHKMIIKEIESLITEN